LIFIINPFVSLVTFVYFFPSLHTFFTTQRYTFGMPQTLLIIEDEPELVRVLRSYLEKAGYIVLSALRGDTGLTTWEDTNPDLVILDSTCRLAIDVAPYLPQHPPHPNHRSARTDELTSRSALSRADDYIPKPSPASSWRASAITPQSQPLHGAKPQIDLKLTGDRHSPVMVSPSTSPPPNSACC
jgi:CheY-like chemotaxis protein